MSAFATVVTAVERVTRIRRRLAAKIKADCPLCGRKNRLEVVQFSSGTVGIVCHGGCDREALREQIGLGWREFFDDVPYRPAPRRSAAQHVLHAVTALRWTIVTHAFAEEDRDLAFAVEIVERLLPARHRVRDLLRVTNGTPIVWHEFPLTVGFVMQLGTRLLGQKVGERRARGLIHLLVEHGLIEQVGMHVVDGPDGPKFLPIFRLGLRTMRSWDKQLRYALEATSLLASPGVSNDPATPTVLSDADLLSTLGDEVSRQLRAASAGFGALGRPPPALHMAERWR